jgi:hypothetical protein
MSETEMRNPPIQGGSTEALSVPITEHQYYQPHTPANWRDLYPTLQHAQKAYTLFPADQDGNRVQCRDTTGDGAIDRCGTYEAYFKYGGAYQTHSGEDAYGDYAP